ncbi:MAG: hypothetical protein HUJ59_04305 [Bacilli bacterium]|nr:hypothetical protein [Bacilli bacterium]MCF0125112.1 hypothetical protein [Clostridia bacterium]
MKKLNSQQFEEAIKNIKDIRPIDTRLIPNFDEYCDEDKKRLIYEWTVFSNFNEQLKLLDKYLDEKNDNEPHTPSRISRQLDVSLELGTFLYPFILEKEMDEIKGTCDRKDPLYYEVENLLEDESLEEGRKEKIKEEYEFLIRSGSLSSFLTALDISRMFKEKNQYYQIYGRITSSLIAYHLHIHNIDCYKEEIILREKIKNLEFVVSQDYQVYAFDKVENLLFSDMPLVKESYSHNEKDYCSPGRYILLENLDDLKHCSFINDYTDKCVPSIGSEKKKNLTNPHVEVSIYSRWQITFVQKMNALSPISNIDVSDVKCVKEYISSGSKYLLKSFGVDKFLNESKINEKPLSHEDIVKYISMDILNTDNEDDISSKDEALEILLKYLSFDEAFNIAYSSNVGDTLEKSNLKDKIEDKDYQRLIRCKNLWRKSDLMSRTNTFIYCCYYLVNFSIKANDTFLECCSYTNDLFGI